MRKTSLFCAFVFLGIWTASGYAQTADIGHILVVTPKRTGEPQEKTSSRVQVISREQIESTQAASVPDVLRSTLGVRVYDNGTVKTSTVDVRGFGEAAKQNVLVLVDGRRTNAIDISGADWVQIPVDLVERIEVVRGGGSVLYGDNAVGGVINIITRRSDQPLQVETLTSAGSYDTYGQDVLVSGAHADTRYQAYYKYYRDGGWRQNSDGISRDGNISLGRDVTDKVSVDVRLGSHNDIQHQPGSLRLMDLPALSRKGTRFPEDFSDTEEWYVDSTVKWRMIDDEDYQGTLEVTLNRRDRDTFSSYFSGAARTAGDIQTDGVLLKYVSESQINGHPLTGIVGVDYYDHENDIRGSGLYNSEDLTISKTEVGVYSTLEYDLTDKLSANAGTRFHQAEYVFDQRDVVTYASQRPDEWVSQGGLEYEYADQSFVHADIRQTFRFLATDEFYSSGFAPPTYIAPGLNPGLRQQTGVEYEWGVRHSFGAGVGVNLTNYLHDIKDEIYFDPNTFLNGNYDQTRRVGFELAPSWDVLQVMDWKAFSRFSLEGAYTYQEAEFRGGNYSGNEIPFVPQHQLAASVEMGFREHYSVMLTGRRTGESRAVNDQSNVKPVAKAYTVFDTEVAYETSLKKFDWKIFGRVENVFDRVYNSYEIEGSNRAIYPAPGREFLVGVKAKF